MTFFKLRDIYFFGLSERIIICLSIGLQWFEERPVQWLEPEDGVNSQVNDTDNILFRKFQSIDLHSF
jgi:hypothetical protein